MRKLKILFKSPIVVAALFIIINCVVVYFGRIYYPDNFHPNEVKFFDNLWVICLGEIIIITFFTIAICIIWYFAKEIKKTYKELKNE